MLCMIRLLLSLILLFLALGSLWAVPPLLNYAGQVSVDGQRFDGEAKLKFALVNPAGSVTYWSQDGTSENGSEPTGHVSTQVSGGLYSILIGNTAISGMGELDASVFQEHDDAHLRVWFSDGINGFERIVPDRPFAAVPYALSAGSALAKHWWEEGSLSSTRLSAIFDDVRVYSIALPESEIKILYQLGQ